MSFSPTLFARALRKWHAAGWRTISLLDAVQQLTARKPFPEKTFVFTFDDGYASVYRFAFPVLQACNMTATVFIAPSAQVTDVTALLPTLYDREMLRWNQIREMRAYGIHFGSHSLSHRELTGLDETEVNRELEVSQKVIADSLGEPIPLFAYPRGKSNARIRELTSRYYTAACTDRLGIAHPNSDLFALERVETYYFRGEQTSDVLTRSWFPLYVQVRNLPRRLRRILLK